MDRPRRLIWRLAAFLVLVLGTTTLAVVLAPNAGAVTHRQVITVSASSSASTYAKVEAWQLQPNGAYKRVAGPWTARIGASYV